MKKLINIYKSLFIFIFMFLSSVLCWGQNKYKTYQYVVQGEAERYESSVTYVSCSKENTHSFSDGTFTSGTGAEAFDGKTETLWCVDGMYNKEAYIIANLGAEYQSVKSVDMLFSTADRCPKSLKVYSSTSDDGTSGDWTELCSVDDIQSVRSDGHVVGNFTTDITGQYIKIVISGAQEESGTGARTYLYEVSFNTNAVNVEITQSTDIFIKHKPAKWYNIASKLQGIADDFDEKCDSIPSMITVKENGKEIQVQNTHTLVDTLYVKKGSSTWLKLPDWLNNNISNKTYQRWYNYETGGTFRTNNIGSEEIWDYLTPATNDEIQQEVDASNHPNNGQGWRFANGYVGGYCVNGKLSDKKNENNEPKALYFMKFYYPKDGESSYKIACDVSGYNDYTENYSDESKNAKFLNDDGTACEPTLSHRFIFYVKAVDELKKGVDGVEEDGIPPVDVKNITMPARRIPNNTEEMVALSRDARGYAINSNDPNEEIVLTATIEYANGENNKANISLLNSSDGVLTLSGDDRIIHFKYNGKGDGNTETVDDGSRASIVVKNGATEVARFNLTFEDDDILLSQSQVEELDKKNNDANYVFTDATDNPKAKWHDLGERTPTYLNDNYQLLTDLNFDYSENIASQVGYLDNVYPFPLRWSSSSYGFYDGSAKTGIDEFEPSNGTNQYPEWGYYALMNNYVECPGGWKEDSGAPVPNMARPNKEGDPSTYHLYADVSDRPGVIARLPFDRQLCAGTELLVTAWVKCARSAPEKANAGVLFTVMGVNKDDAGNETYTPIYSYQTGQIPTTYRNDKSVKLPGFKDESNEWMQAYFTFINRTNRNFDSYAIQIDNNSASTNGGDLYIDDIRVYIATVNPEVTQLDANCSDDPTRVNIKMDWSRLMSRIGNYDESLTGDGQLCFCLLDKDTYEANIGSNSEGEQIKAITESAMLLKTANTVIGTGNKFLTLGFDYTFTNNAEYSLTGGDSQTLVSSGNFFRKSDGSIRELTGDFYADLKANHTYMMVVLPDGFPTSDADFAEKFAGRVDADQCNIVSEFTVVPRNTFKVNGTILKPELDYCKGQTYNFTAEVRKPKLDANDDYIRDPETGRLQYESIDQVVYFDWFFGTEDEYAKKQSGEGYVDVRLDEALQVFRDIYPDADVVDEMTTPVTGTFSSDMFNLLKYYSEEAEGSVGGQHAHPLVLHQQSLNITLLDELNLIARPIPVKVDGEQGDEQIAVVCWDYIPLTLRTEESAPSVKPGFNDVLYPDEINNLDPCLRIGLDQIKSVSTSGDAVLTVDLRDAQYSSGNGANNVDRLVIATDSEGKDINGLYLVSTDDPEYTALFGDGSFVDEGIFDELSLPVGTVKSFEASHFVTGTTTRNNKMTVQFDLSTERDITLADGTQTKFKFTPKEGYTYNLAVHFEEKMKDGSKSPACAGHMVLPIKVVPEYVKWVGSADGEGNWNNDGNWERVSANELKMANAPQGGDENLYDVSVYNNRAGFVPMLFTKVIMPENSKVKLYRAGYNNKSWGLGDPNDEDDSQDIPTQKPTLNIQYDLMAYGNEPGKETTGDITTQLYRVNLCDEIHFEEGAEMLRPEYLLYNKAWIEMEVPAGEWTLVSTPLQDVVSGDWYTSQSGTQDTEYFKDIIFNDEYSRLKPFVTQRTWTDGATIVENSGSTSTDDHVPASFTATWSALFNDTSVPYTSGNGYSVKTAGIKSNDDGTKGEYETLTFRFPKADASYDFSAGTISRGNPGRFITDEILKRVDQDAIEANEAEEQDLTVELTNIATRGTARYAIVGNPFMANLDVSKFIDANSGVLEAKYWIDSNVEGEGSEAGTATQSGDTWTETEGNGLVGQYKAFCVQLKASAEPKVTFTPDMAVLSSTTETTTTNNLVIKAESASGITSAALAYDVQANDGYVSAEDAELITDILGNGGKPSVYTVADNVAVSVNKIKDLRLIPVGLFATEDYKTTLTFTGVASLLEPTLYDAETNTETPLTEGYALTVEGASHGRYFIRTRGAGEGTTDIEETVAGGDNSVSVYSVEQGKVVVASGTGLKDVMIYSVGGALLKNESVGAGLTACTIDNVDSGVVIVKVVTPEGTTTRKIMVK